jgi:hypothetical protein
MAGDSDTGYKQLFAHPELVRDLLAGFTPFACFDGLDAAAFERVNASYVSERFSERHGDMVWRVRLGGGWVYVYIVLEFQSRNERWMALRVQVYVGLLYQDLVKRHELSPQATLPPVLPLVLYNGALPWSASTELGELIMDAPAGLEGLQARQRFQLIDQHSFDPATLAGSKNLVAALFRLELSDSPDVLIETVATLGMWLGDDAQAPLRRSIGNWIERLQQREFDGIAMPGLRSLLEGETMGERYQRKYATWADALEDRGLQKGLAKGREQGREEGRLDAMRGMLKRLLVQRFGALQVAVLARIDSAQADDIERWTDRVLGADSLDSVFGPAPG